MHTEVHVEILAEGYRCNGSSDEDAVWPAELLTVSVAGANSHVGQ
jgi:hypothetical protein